MAAIKKGLAALTAAAFSLPGMVPNVSAETPPLAPEIDTNFSRYAESSNRMRADVYQASGILPFNDRLSFNVNGVKDVISGASPMMNIRGAGGKLTQVRSRATIRDVRDAVDINANYYLDDITLGVGVGTSNENDYASDFFNLNSRWELNQKMTTLAASFGYASDQVWEALHPHMANASIHRSHTNGGDKNTRQGMLGITQVLDKNSLLQANLTYGVSDGYLSDPYKFAMINTAIVRDNRPTTREQYAFLVRYVRNFEALNSAALHLDYRFYSDTWGIDAHTFEASWHQPLPFGVKFMPRLRYYSQTEADFYQPLYTSARADGYYSSDYRLANYGDISGGAQLSKEFFSHLKVTGSVDFFDRKKSYHLSQGAGTALDNFSYSMYSVSVNWKF